MWGRACQNANAARADSAGAAFHFLSFFSFFEPPPAHRQPGVLLLQLSPVSVDIHRFSLNVSEVLCHVKVRLRRRAPPP